MENRGFTLPGVIVAIGIAIFASTVMLSIFSTQFRETKALQEKLESLALERLLIDTLADGTVCSYVLNNPSQVTFNSTKSLPQKLVPNSPLYAKIISGKPGPVVAKVGKIAPSDALEISSIYLELLSGTSDTFFGNWVVEFSGENTVRQIKPLKISTVVTADLSFPAAATISNCQSSTNSFGAAAIYGYKKNSIDYPYQGLFGD